MTKKILYGLLIWLSIISTINLANAQNTQGFWAWGDWWIEVPWMWNEDTPWTWNEPKLITVLKTTINRILWILWAIALVLCLWWWFQMLTAAGDESKVKSWTKVLKHAAIWLVVIWLSWLLVRFVFRIINSFTQ